MAEEFVDLYEILELPIEADRNLLRKRVNELYLDAQRNLDHRNFQTRVKYQELFEITLPQARYILLDEGRRHEYDRLVRAYRAAQSGEGGVPEPDTAMPAKPAAPVEPGIPGAAPPIDPLPTAGVDPAQLAKEREELWSKWKTGLESAMAKEKDSEERTVSPAAQTSSTSSSHSLSPDTPASARPAVAGPGTRSQPARQARPQAKVNFQFNEGETSNVLSDAEEEERAARAATEKRRDQHRRDIMKDVLVNVALIWSSVGAAAVIVPGFIILTVAGNILYPANKPQLWQWLPKAGYWGAGLGMLVIGAVFLARALSKKMRQKTVAELSRMTYEELITRTGKG